MKLLKQFLYCEIPFKNVPGYSVKNVWLLATTYTRLKYFHTLVFKRSINMAHGTTNRERQFSPKRAVILRKVTRYEFEKTLLPNETEEKLKHHLTSRNSDYDHLLNRHNYHQQCVRIIEDSLRSKGIETQTVARYNLTPDLIDWADVVFTAGGDGTFLLAASVVNNQSTPIVGVNTDPQGSLGHLCLPKGDYGGLNFKAALERLLAGKFSWRWRQRIRITMSGRHADDDPVNLHDEQLDNSEDRFSEHVKEREQYEKRHAVISEKRPRVLPVLALNEVFMGERLSSRFATLDGEQRDRDFRVSYYEVSFDWEPSLKQRSSGITVSTGTGSTSWLLNINYLCPQSVKDILKIANQCASINFDYKNKDLCRTVADTFNRSLVFDPSEPKMSYAIRDPFHNAVSKVPKSRGFTKRIELRSRMWDACLVVDGGSSFKFNDGSVATLEILEEDALKTVTFAEDT